MHLPPRVSPQFAAMIPGEFQRFGRLVAVIKNLVKGNPQGAGPLFQRFHSGNGVAILYTGYIRLHQPRSLSDLNLAHFLGFANFPQLLTYQHTASLQHRRISSKLGNFPEATYPRTNLLRRKASPMPMPQRAP